MLDALGMTKNDRSVYGVWFRHPMWTTPMVARELGIPDHEVVASRRSLVEKGLLVTDPANSRWLTPVPPDVVADRWLADIEAGAALARAEAMRARAQLSALVSAQLTGHGGGPAVQRIHGGLLCQVRIDELVRAARRDIVALRTDRPSTRGLTGARTELDQRALRQGVIIRVLYQHDQVVRREDLAYARSMAREGAQIRTAARVATEAIVVDGATAAVTTHRAADPVTLVLTDLVMAEALADLFVGCWHHGQRFMPGRGTETASDASGEPLSPNDRTLLQLLALGTTDEVAARTMGVSVRTVRRHMSLLLDRLNAVSRFQAGVEAARRGWL